MDEGKQRAQHFIGLNQRRAGDIICQQKIVQGHLDSNQLLQYNSAEWRQI